MMDKIEEILHKSIIQMEDKYHPYYIDGYGDGFDGAISLHLPVKFAKYLAENFKLSTELGWINKSDGEWMEEEDIYETWRATIYTPEQ